MTPRLLGIGDPHIKPANTAIDYDHLSIPPDVDAIVTNGDVIHRPDPGDIDTGREFFERLNESAYVLDVPIEEAGNASRSCSGAVRYNGTMRIPAGDDLWTLIVKQDGETVTTLRGDSDSSLLGGSTSVSGSVSAPARSDNSTNSS